MQVKNEKEKVRRLRSTNELFFGGGGRGWLSKGKHLFNITSLQMYSCFYSSLYEWRPGKKKREKSNMPSHVTENSKSSS